MSTIGPALEAIQNFQHHGIRYGLIIVAGSETRVLVTTTRASSLGTFTKVHASMRNQPPHGQDPLLK